MNENEELNDRTMFARLRDAYLRGAIWRDTNGSMHLVNKAACDYADFETGPSDVILALLSELGERDVGIKPLEWHKSHMTGWNGDWHTISPFTLTVRCADENGWKWTCGGAHGYEPSDEAAKAAAQAEINKRIRSALVPSSEREALRDRVAELEGAGQWRTMDSAPKDGTPFIAVRKWPTRIDASIYRWVGEPDCWLAAQGGTCIRPSYQDEYLWVQIPPALSQGDQP